MRSSSPVHGSTRQGKQESAIPHDLLTDSLTGDAALGPDCKARSRAAGHTERRVHTCDERRDIRSCQPSPCSSGRRYVSLGVRICHVRLLSILLSMILSRLKTLMITFTASDMISAVPADVKRVYLPAVVARKYLERLRLTDFNPMDTMLARRSTMLPWHLWSAAYKGKY